MSFTFPMDAPGRATTGVMDPGLLAAKSVDQVKSLMLFFVRAFKNVWIQIMDLKSF